MSFFQNQNILNIIELVENIILFLLISYLLLTFGKLFKACRLYLKNKSIYQYNELNYKFTKQLSINQKIEVTNSILSMINNLIEIECQNTLKTFITLKQKYEYSKLSDDIPLISSNVYKALDKSIFEDPNILLTGDYLMKYITQQATVVLLGASMKFNEEYQNQA